MAHKRPGWLEKFLDKGDEDAAVQQMTIVPGLIGGARNMVYTGKGSDGRVQTDNPVMVDQTAFHEDEIVVPSTSVSKMGGPKRAMMKIKQLEMKKAEKGATGYEEGGAVLTDKQRLMAGQTAIPSTTATSGLTDKQRIMATQSPTATPTPAPATDLASGVYAAKAGIQAGTDTQKDLTTAAKAAVLPTTTVTPTPDAGLNQKQINQGITTYTPPSAPTPSPVPSATLTAKQQIMGVTEPEAPAGTGVLTPEQVYARNALTTQKGAPLDAAELQKIVDSSPTQLEQQLTAAGLKPQAQQEAADAHVAGQYSQYANEALNQMRAFANGTSDVYQRQANAAFLALDARLQTQLMSAAMRIASQPGLTDGARRTMMAEQMRNAGLAQSSLAGTLADQVMKTAMAATGQAYTMATGERDFQTQQIKDGMAAALQGEDYDTYAKLSKQLYGVDVNLASVKSGVALQKIADGNEFIYTAITNDPNASIATPGVRTALQSIWDAQNPGQPMPEDWATTQLAQMKQASSQAYQFMQGIDNDAAMGLFGGDQARVDGFTFGQYKGLEAVQHAMYGFMTGGAFTVGADGFFDFNEDSPIYKEMMKTFGWDTPANSSSTSAPVAPIPTPLSGGGVNTSGGSAPTSGATSGGTAQSSASPLSFDMDQFNTPISGGTYADLDGKIFDENGDALIDTDEGTQLVRLGDGRIVNPTTNIEFKIGGDGIPEPKTMTVKGVDYNIVGENIFPDWSVVKDDDGNVFYRQKNTAAGIDNIYTYQQLFDTVKGNIAWRQNPTMMADLDKLLVAGGDVASGSLGGLSIGSDFIVSSDIKRVGRSLPPEITGNAQRITDGSNNYIANGGVYVRPDKKDQEFVMLYDDAGTFKGIMQVNMNTGGVSIATGPSMAALGIGIYELK